MQTATTMCVFQPGKKQTTGISRLCSRNLTLHRMTPCRIPRLSAAGTVTVCTVTPSLKGGTVPDCQWPAIRVCVCVWKRIVFIYVCVILESQICFHGGWLKYICSAGKHGRGRRERIFVLHSVWMYVMWGEAELLHNWSTGRGLRWWSWTSGGRRQESWCRGSPALLDGNCSATSCFIAISYTVLRTRMTEFSEQINIYHRHNPHVSSQLRLVKTWQVQGPGVGERGALIITNWLGYVLRVCDIN